MSSFFSILSFGTTHDYIIGIAKYWRKYHQNKKLLQNISWLPTVKCTEPDALCSICLQKLDSAKQLPCKHLFHSQCLEYRVPPSQEIEYGLQTRNCARSAD